MQTWHPQKKIKFIRGGREEGRGRGERTGVHALGEREREEKGRFFPLKGAFT